jgi:MFS transporter, UMF1 family
MSDNDVPRTTAKKVQPTANTLAVGVVGRGLSETPAPRKQVVSWALWDWSNQPFNTVIFTFVFIGIYLVSDRFIDPATKALGAGNELYDKALADLSAQWGLAVFGAGILIAVLAPVMGQRTDASGHRKRWLAISTALTVVGMAALFFVEEQQSFFVFGIVVVALTNVFSEIAAVNYNAMLVQVSTPKTVGKISGLGWGLGYIGGIVALIIVVVITQFEWFGLDVSNGLAFRIIAVGCAFWAVVFALPILFNVPESKPNGVRERVGFFESYVVLVKDVAALFRDSRTTFWFLIASAVYRDGLAGVFAFGAVIATVTFGFDSNSVLLFGVAANLVAGVSTVISGRFDDRFGPRAVILTALGGLIVAGLVVFFFHDGGQMIFWIFGLILTIFVGPAQAASRSLLARVTPAGREGEIFGLYATTGRAASWLSPGLWAAFITIFGFQYWGVLGIVLVLIIGFVLLLLVKAGTKEHLAG